MWLSDTPANCIVEAVLVPSASIARISQEKGRKLTRLSGGYTSIGAALSEQPSSRDRAHNLNRYDETEHRSCPNKKADGALDRIDALSCVGPYFYHSIDRYHRPIDLFLSYLPNRNCVLDPNCSHESIAACASRLITGPLIAGRNGEAQCNTPQPNNKNQASRELWQERNRSSPGGPRPTADRFRRETVRHDMLGSDVATSHA